MSSPWRMRLKKSCLEGKASHIALAKMLLEKRLLVLDRPNQPLGYGTIAPFGSTWLIIVGPSHCQPRPGISSIKFATIILDLTKHSTDLHVINYNFVEQKEQKLPH